MLRTPKMPTKFVHMSGTEAINRARERTTNRATIFILIDESIFEKIF